MTKIALISGANKGIGFEIARGLHAAGVTVLIGSRSAERGAAAVAAVLADSGPAAGLGVVAGSGMAVPSGGIDTVPGVAEVRTLALDVTDPASIAAAVAEIEARYGVLDILVNNAGVLVVDGSGAPSETTVETMRTVYETNVFGVVAMTNAMLPLLRAAPAARIVNVSSDLGSLTWALDPAHPYWQARLLAYSSSKTALNMVTANYAKELWDTPIKVNAANPGYCATDLNAHSGWRTPEQGAQIAIRLALLDADGPTGAFLEDAGTLPW
ncbi:NAD(P)-dependent dehydrogenase (short-subunit alcohol dehydrogenase family) [Allocatelliglobosispora scoriae]|uniref:NAD(P)-dependent dehydrogenase (Short-subunit alcohol dehydrogenase family) n=1 Tax=Allocatelliglobosispora scoriae TaxID=643052 RepID=A0A841BU85_9ACTN|nr:SDR family NAD(P)-dependent oxidoreductase [Allocatelliglobosispora scoriae]MBB5871008.1 NAD(P)-dependent dehydrogenase (short-subunit alcohol dehydrogenase family) [Allocatelliglobosispora scoriae]